MAKPSKFDLLGEICRLGLGEIPEHTLRYNLNISHGYFCRLRQQLIRSGHLIVTHPRRKACYNVPNGWQDELFDRLDEMCEDMLSVQNQIA